MPDGSEPRGRYDAAFYPLPGVDPVPLLDTTSRHCRWPVETGTPGYFSCGGVREQGSAYCAIHREMGRTVGNA